MVLVRLLLFRHSRPSRWRSSSTCSDATAATCLHLASDQFDPDTRDRADLRGVRALVRPVSDRGMGVPHPARRRIARAPPWGPCGRSRASADRGWATLYLAVFKGFHQPGGYRSTCTRTRIPVNSHPDVARHREFAASLSDDGGNGAGVGCRSNLPSGIGNVNSKSKRPRQ